jgi:alpha-beta hydrolase superfamily lysophospholipase
MPHSSFTLTTRDRLALHAETFVPDTPINSVVLIVHGTGEHIGRYANIINALNASSIAVMTFDLRGHGHSQGPRGHSPSFDLILDDIALLLQKAEGDFPGIPLFLLGHSMGGNFVLNYAIRHRPNLCGVIALSPGLRTATPTPPWKLALGKVLYRLLPAMTLHNGVRPADLSRDPEIVRSVLNDPLYHYRISARLGIDILNAGVWALDHADQFPLPLLIMHGTADRLTSYEASREFASKVKTDCTLKLWDNLYHELHNEPEKDQVLEFITNWIRERLNAANGLPKRVLTGCADFPVGS